MSIQSTSTVSQPVIASPTQFTAVGTTSKSSSSGNDRAVVVVTIDNSSVKPQSAADQLSRTISGENAMLSIYNKIDWSRVKGTADQIKAAQEADTKKFADEESDTIAFAKSNSLDTSNISFTPVNTSGTVQSAGDDSVAQLTTVASLSTQAVLAEQTNVGTPAGDETKLQSDSLSDSKPANPLTRPDAGSAVALAVLQRASRPDDKDQTKTDLYA